MTRLQRVLVTLFGLYLISQVVFARESKMNEYEIATFAGGCFWCMEAPFDKLSGVLGVTVGYTGGRTQAPTYETVSTGNTGHAEVVQILFDPEKITYQELLETFWQNIDPTVKNAQFCDVGSQYRAAIFYHNESQKKIAQQSKDTLIKSGRFEKIHTTLEPFKTFYKAEDYHQHYYKKNPIRYKFYRYNCGRDKRLKKLWGE